MRWVVCAGVIAAAFAQVPRQTVSTADPAQQGAYPTRPLRLIVPFAPGGATDIVARHIGLKLGESWGQQVVIDNRPGGSGLLAAETASKAAPDGHTLFLGTISSLATNVSMYRKLRYDPVRDFAPVTLVSASPYLIAAHPSLPAQTLRELIALANARPGQMNYGSTGGANHLAMELFKSMAGIGIADIAFVPYRGGGSSLVDLMGGRLQLAIGATLSIMPHVKGGRVRGLAVTGAERCPILPAVPTVAEWGVPGYVASSWNGILVPARTPETIVARLNREIVRILSTSEVRDAISEDCSQAGGGTPEEFSRHIKAEIAKWAVVVKAVGARAD